MYGSDGLRLQRLVRDGCAVVQPFGVLDTTSSGAMRDAVLAESVEEPRAVVVDLDGLRVARPASLSVFPELSAQMSAFPGVPLALAGGTHRLPGTYPDVGAAVAGVAPPPPRRRRHIELSCTGGASRLARRWIRDVCAEWALTPDAEESAEIVGSELVENMVEHARSAGRLRLGQDPDGLSVAVYDDDPHPPRLEEFTSHRSDGGRGIAMVAALASTWGHSPRRPTGKVIWAILPFPLGPVAPGVPAAALRQGFRRSGMTASQLWLGYIAMGGSMRRNHLEAVLRHADIPGQEHDILALTLNEHLAELGLPPIPYRADPAPDAPR